MDFELQRMIDDLADDKDELQKENKKLKEQLHLADLTILTLEKVRDAQTQKVNKLINKYTLHNKVNYP